MQVQNLVLKNEFVAYATCRALRFSKSTSAFKISSLIYFVAIFKIAVQHSSSIDIADSYILKYLCECETYFETNLVYDSSVHMEARYEKTLEAENLMLLYF